MTLALTTGSLSRRDHLSDAKLREAVANVVRRLVPQDEVDDVVQAAFTEALVSAGTPDGADDLRRWVIAIARNKAADLHRRRRREQVGDTPEVEAPSGPQSASDLLRWAEKELPEGEGAHETLSWMLREGAGEKLESIAESEHIPAPRIRQRVARMRKHFRDRWAAQSAIGASIVIALLVGLWAWKRLNPPERIVRDVPSATPFDKDGDPIQRGQELRRFAFEKCQEEAWKLCLDGLDDAAKLDPEGDRSDDVAKARQAARDHLAVPPINSNTPTSPVPLSTTETPRPKNPSDSIGDIQPAVPNVKPAPTTAPFGSNAAPSTFGSNAAPTAPPPRPLNSTGLGDLGAGGIGDSGPKTNPSNVTKPSMGKAPSKGGLHKLHGWARAVFSAASLAKTRAREAFTNKSTASRHTLGGCDDGHVE